MGAVLFGAGMGCVGGVPAQDEGLTASSDEIEVIDLTAEVVDLDGRVAHPGDAPPREPAEDRPESEVCQCETQACRDAWTSENFGCNVCVVVPCQETGNLHACHFCDE